MENHMASYGRLEFALYSPATVVAGFRGEGMKLICPNTVGKYAIRYYDSTEMNDHNPGRWGNEGVRE
jgi:hypothetical protein